MKKSLFAVVVLTATCFSVANAAIVVSKISAHNSVTVSATPPAAVQQAFVTLFGNVTVKEWKLLATGNGELIF